MLGIDGNLIPLDKSVKITRETDEFVKDGFVRNEDLYSILGEEDLSLIGKDIPTGNREVKKLELEKLNEKEFIEKKVKEGKGVDFLCNFYPPFKKAIEKSERYPERVSLELGRGLVIDEKGQVISQGEAKVKPHPEEFKELKEKGFDVDSILSQYKFIHPELWKKCHDYLPEVKRIKYKDICEEAVLPKIKINSPKPSKENAMLWARLLKDGNLLPKEKIWVVDAKDEVRSSGEIFLADQYDPLHKWQGFKFPDIDFLSKEYLNLDNDPEGWKNFFQDTSLKGYQDEDYRDYIRNNILPLIKGESAKKLPKDLLIQYTRSVKECSLYLNEPIYVLTKNDEIESSDNVYFSPQYSPKENWENQDIIPVEILSAEYIGKEEDALKWKDFFRGTGVKEETNSEIIERFALEVTETELRKRGYEVSPFGGPCDLKAKKEGAKYYIEVKGRSGAEVKDIRLDTNEARLAQDKKDFYFLANVINIPNKHVLYLLKKPTEREGVTIEMVIPKSTIERDSERIE